MPKVRGIEIIKSPRRFKKYRAVFKDYYVDFGDSRYGQYMDRALGIYSHLNHKDNARRRAYFRRFSGVDTKGAALAKELDKVMDGKYNAKILSHLYLW